MDYQALGLDPAKVALAKKRFQRPQRRGWRLTFDEILLRLVANTESNSNIAEAAGVTRPAFNAMCKVVFEPLLGSARKREERRVSGLGAQRIVREFLNLPKDNPLREIAWEATKRGYSPAPVTTTPGKFRRTGVVRVNGYLGVVREVRWVYTPRTGRHCGRTQVFLGALRRADVLFVLVVVPHYTRRVFVIPAKILKRHMVRKGLKWMTLYLPLGDQRAEMKGAPVPDILQYRDNWERLAPPKPDAAPS